MSCGGSVNYNCIKCKYFNIPNDSSITAQMVKELRELTGAGMYQCKQALLIANGDIELSADLLHVWSLCVYIKCPKFEHKD